MDGMNFLGRDAYNSVYFNVPAHLELARAVFLTAVTVVVVGAVVLGLAAAGLPLPGAAEFALQATGVD